MGEARESRFQRFRIGFTAVVLGGLALAVLVEHSRPSRSELPVFEPSAPVELDPLVLPGGPHAVSGTVTTGDGAPAEGVLVELTQAGEPRWAYSDRAGRFELTGLAPGEVSVALVVLGRPPVRHTVMLPADDVHWTLPEPYAPIEELPPVERAALYGKLSSPLGRAPEGYELVLEPTAARAPLSGVVPRRVRIISDGLFTLTDLALGEYRAFVVPLWAEGGSWPRLSERTYEHIASAADLQIVLDSGGAVGRLVTDTGAPLEGALVNLWDADRPERVWSPQRSGVGGTFEFVDLPPGEYVVDLRAGDTRVESRVRIRARQVETVEFGPIRMSTPRE